MVEITPSRSPPKPVLVLVLILILIDAIKVLSTEHSERSGLRLGPLGSGDGTASRYRLVKTYGEQRRAITRPDLATLIVAVGGLPITAWRFETGGWIVFDTAPANGAPITAGFLFDVPVRFAEDRLDVSGLSFAAGEAPSVPLIEIREAA